jgi:hypothetical protein
MVILHSDLTDSYTLTCCQIQIINVLDHPSAFRKLSVDVSSSDSFGW